MQFKLLLNAIRELFLSDKLSSEPVLLFRLSMFKHVVVVSCFCICVLNIYFLSVGKIFTAIVLFINFFFYCFCYYLTKRKKEKLGTTLFLLAVTLTTCLFMWRNEGLFDEAILAFPGFIMFAVMISNFGLARWLFLIISANILAIGLANEYGFHTHSVNESDLDSAVVMIILLLMVTLSVYLVTRGSLKLIVQLEAENNKVTKSKKEIIRLHNHDPLTGLPNRFLGEKIFEERLKIGAREGFETSLLFIDLDNFKQVNDTFGHAAGDALLKTISQRLQKSVRDTDTVCRFGGDEFIIIAIHERATYKPKYSVLGEKLLKVLSEPIGIGGNQISPTVSIGIAVAPGQASTFKELYKKADLAMYATKQGGRNNYQYFNDDMHNDSTRQLVIAQGLRSALVNNEFILHYQSTQTITNDQITGAEALLRWQHPTLGHLSPDEFIPIAEQSGSIADIGYWVLNEAVKACKNWHMKGFDTLCVAVNVSAMQFHRTAFEKSVETVLDEHNLEGKFLVLELTESLLFDVQNKLHGAIEQIKSLGVSVAIDDFGTGYSNLGYLHKNDINILKIDRSFVSNILQSKQDAAIVATIINMSKTLGMTVVAEGVESKDIKHQLLQMGCTYGQGYLWSKPVCDEDFIALLTKGTSSTIP